MGLKIKSVENGDAEIAGFTYDDLYEVIKNTQNPLIKPPANESDYSTVSGPVAAAEKFDFDVIRDLVFATSSEV